MITISTCGQITVLLPELSSDPSRRARGSSQFMENFVLVDSSTTKIAGRLVDPFSLANFSKSLITSSSSKVLVRNFPWSSTGRSPRLIQNLFKYNGEEELLTLTVSGSLMVLLPSKLMFFSQRQISSKSLNKIQKSFSSLSFPSKSLKYSWPLIAGSISRVSI